MSEEQPPFAGCRTTPHCVYATEALRAGMELFDAASRGVDDTYSSAPVGSDARKHAADMQENISLRRATFKVGIQAETLRCNGIVCAVALAAIDAYIQQTTG